MARRGATASQAASASRLDGMFAESGTTFERRPDGRVAVANWPKPRSGGSFLRDMVADMEADRAARGEDTPGRKA